MDRNCSWDSDTDLQPKIRVWLGFSHKFKLAWSRVLVSVSEWAGMMPLPYTKSCPFPPLFLSLSPLFLLSSFKLFLLLSQSFSFKLFSSFSILYLFLPFLNSLSTPEEERVQIGIKRLNKGTYENRKALLVMRMFQSNPVAYNCYWWVICSYFIWIKHWILRHYLN